MLPPGPRTAASYWWPRGISCSSSQPLASTERCLTPTSRSCALKVWIPLAFSLRLSWTSVPMPMPRFLQSLAFPVLVNSR